VRYLTLEQREWLFKHLQARAQTLHEEIRAGLHPDGRAGDIGFANRRDETDDDAVADLESSLDVSAVARDVLELHEVESALRRIHTGDYGTCSECGADIPYSRLVAQPTALRCTACQERHERAHGATARTL
jgi:RNA polymerase-binding transcription factor